jgi:DNA-binding PadR family transcriptional regulator
MGKQSLGEFELLVLLAALRLGEEGAHAVSIVDEIRERTGREVLRSAVYVTLQRLEKKGLVSTRMGDPVPERGGKGRRLVAVGDAGLEAVRDTQDALRSMWGGLDPLLEEGR